MFNLKKLLWSSAVVAFLLLGCRDSPENRDEETPADSEDATEEIEDVEADETSEDEIEAESTDTLVGTITDTELTSIDDYDESKWTYADLSSIDHMLENEVFQEENDLYIGTGNNSVMSLGSDFTSVWEDENPYGYQVSIAIDDNYLYNPALGGKRSSGDTVKALDKGTGEVVYEIDIGDYAEMSEILIDDEAFYLTLGYMSDPEEDIYADNISLHKFDKANGYELWSIDFDGVRLSGNRPHHYKLTQSDDLIYLAEEESQKLVARSKEDGSEVWSTEFGERDEAIRHGQTYTSDGSVYVIDGNYVFHIFDEETGEKQAEYDYDGEVPGAMVPFPVFYEDLVFWQDVDEDIHHLKAVNPKAEEELRTLDMDGYFLVDYAMLDGTLYAFFGSLDFDAEENTLMVRIEPETGEVLDMIDMGDHMSAKYNNFYIHMGLTEHDGNLAYFYKNHLFIFNE